MRDAASARIEFGMTGRNGDLVEFCLRDNGAGIGLATVQRVIVKHGGEIRGEGRPGAGGNFYFMLPA